MSARPAFSALSLMLLIQIKTENNNLNIGWGDEQCGSYNAFYTKVYENDISSSDCIKFFTDKGVELYVKNSFIQMQFVISASLSESSYGIGISISSQTHKVVTLYKLAENCLDEPTGSDHDYAVMSNSTQVPQFQVKPIIPKKYFCH
jgi:hypothetical protein